MKDTRNGKFAAHIREDGRVQSVQEHLANVAALAASFGRAFGAEAQARLAGLLHDIGKYCEAFQRRIHGTAERVDHSTAGAQAAFHMRQPEAAFAIAGHHGGLPDMGSRVDAASSATLLGRLKRKTEICEQWREEIGLPEDIPHPCGAIARDGFAASFYIRMLFSCLVDADYLDTERFMCDIPLPRGSSATMEELLDRLLRYTEKWRAPRSALDRRRNDILAACLREGERAARGLYTLTVPTGGGKTIASLAFALAMARAQGMQRVIYVIPYTSIIDQNAAVFSGILGEENVLEHHSGVEYALDEDATLAQGRKALAVENWDAPVVVTTAVQFFESLYAARPSRCRKLHNIANSVVVFDEAQALPVAALTPCVAAIAELVAHYGVTAVLCTATQPALGPLFEKLAPGMRMRELCPSDVSGDALFRRTTLRVLGETTRDELARRLSCEAQVLCVVNRRAEARALSEALPAEGTFCLTTLLCPADRKALLAEIRQRLQEGLPCKVVSTSLIEAGVDVDFPVAYRELAGLDSILQTAGRCNREGKRAADGSPVYVFSLEKGAPRMLERNVDATRRILREFEDLTSPQAIERYFTFYRTLAGDAQLDVCRAYERLKAGSFAFSSVAADFHLIEQATRTLYIPRGEGAALIEALRQGARSRTLFRKLGQYAVNVYPQQLRALEDAGCVEWLDEEVPILWRTDAYDPRKGLSMDVEGGNGFFV